MLKPEYISARRLGVAPVAFVGMMIAAPFIAATASTSSATFKADNIVAVTSLTSNGTSSLGAASSSSFSNTGNTTLGDANSDTITWNAVGASALDMGTHQIRNVSDPTSAQDVATQAYALAHAGIGGSVSANKLPVMNADGTFHTSTWSDTGSTTSTTAPATINNKLTAVGVGGGPSLSVTHSMTAQTVDSNSIDSTDTSTWNTTAAAHTTIGLNQTCANSISSGSNTLTSKCAYFSNTSSGANITAFALQTDVGNDDFNATSGTSTFHHGLNVSGDSLTVGSTLFTVASASGNTTIAGSLGVSTGINANTITVTGQATVASGSNGVKLTIGGASTTAHISAPDTVARPTLSTCGTSPTVVGSDVAGIITTGSGATACTLTFNTAYANSPACIVTPRDGTFRAYTVSTTALSLTAASASAAYDYVCIGHG